MNHTPAEIIAKHLIDEGLFFYPTQNEIWPIFVDHLPGNKNIKSAGLITNTQGILDGRLMEGTVIKHPGIQIVVRSKDYKIGFQKINSITEELDAVVREIITMGDDTQYMIHNLSRSSTIFSMGLEEETRTHLFSVNYRVTLSLQEEEE